MAHNLGYLQDLPIGRFFNFAWYMFTRNMDRKELEKFRSQVWRPPVGEMVNDSRSPWSVENEGKALRAFKSQIGGGAS